MFLNKCDVQSAAPIALVKKKEWEFRMCVDLQRIYSNTKVYRWPLIKINELMSYLANANKVFASFDLLPGVVPMAWINKTLH